MFALDRMRWDCPLAPASPVDLDEGNARGSVGRLEVRDARRASRRVHVRAYVHAVHVAHDQLEGYEKANLRESPPRN